MTCRVNLSIKVPYQKSDNRIILFSNRVKLKEDFPLCLGIQGLFFLIKTLFLAFTEKNNAEVTIYLSNRSYAL